MLSREQHPYHLVDSSPWPILTSMAVFNLALSGLLYLHYFKYSGYMLLYSLCFLLLCMGFWFWDIIREACYEGRHTKPVQQSLAIGMILFIISEVMFFFSFFWAFFHSSLAPVPEIGGVWPPPNIEVISPWGIPLANTLILLSSGVTITLAHKCLLEGEHRQEFIRAMFVTIFLGLYFTALQIFEYANAPFSIWDGIYGSVFYMATGFHGLHVLIGTIFIIVCLIREFHYHFTPEHHFGFVACIWYWHFVDIVWIFLYFSIYVWGGK